MDEVGSDPLVDALLYICFIGLSQDFGSRERGSGDPLFSKHSFG
jgi:hypothetical protein